jgi:hypothetical protein
VDQKPQFRQPTPGDDERARATMFDGWADLFEPMLPPDRYRLLLQLGKLGLIGDEQAQGLAKLWGRR